MSDDPDQLLEALRRLHGAVAHWQPNRWQTVAPDGRRRGEVIFALIADLVVLGRRAGSGTPPSASPARIGVHALADQLAVVAAELLAAPDIEDVRPDAAASVAATRTLLLGR